MINRNYFTFENVVFYTDGFSLYFDVRYFDDDNTLYHAVDYLDAVMALNSHIKHWVTTRDNDYQGCWFAVGFDGDRYWYNQGDFGSCGGCDWLYSINGNIEEYKDFLRAMKLLTPIGNTKEQAITYLQRENENLVTYSDGFSSLIHNMENGNWLINPFHQDYISNDTNDMLERLTKHE